MGAKQPWTAERMSCKRVRTCRWLNECFLCWRNITSGQQYYDGGYGHRAHVECVAKRIASRPSE